MIIRTKKRIADFDVTVEGDKDVFHHAQEISPILRTNYRDRMFGNNGWTDDREFRKIASIPVLEWAKLEKKYPGFLQDKKLLKKILLSEEGEMFRTVPGGI